MVLSIIQSMVIYSRVFSNQFTVNHGRAFSSRHMVNYSRSSSNQSIVKYGKVFNIIWHGSNFSRPSYMVWIQSHVILKYVPTIPTKSSTYILYTILEISLSTVVYYHNSSKISQNLKNYESLWNFAKLSRNLVQAWPSRFICLEMTAIWS